jgi:glycosyltransferase involved in cell wall biosynthesis
LKSKILFILHLPPPVHGAAVAGVNISKSQLINESFDNYFINLTTATSLVDIGKISFKKIISIIFLLFKVLFSFIFHKFDLCFITINSNGPAWVKEMGVVILAKLFRIPIIYFYHNKGVASYANTNLKKELFRFQFKNTKSILLSPLLFHDISFFVNEKDVFYCPYGIKNKLLLFNKEELVNDKNKIVTILYLSNLIKSKGVFVLLNACYLLKQKHIPFRCIFIGGEGDISANEFETIVNQLGLQNEMEYQGKKFDLEKEKAFAGADIFAFPTFYHNECFPIVNLEAMQYALPIITTYEGAIPEAILDGVNGFLVPQKNVDILADKLEILIKDPELRIKMGLAGKKMYEEKFTLEIFEKRMFDILQDCLNQKIA